VIRRVRQELASNGVVQRGHCAKTQMNRLITQTKQ